MLTVHCLPTHGIRIYIEVSTLPIWLTIPNRRAANFAKHIGPSGGRSAWGGH